MPPKDVITDYPPIPEGLNEKQYNDYIKTELTANPKLLSDPYWRLTHLYHIIHKDTGKKVLFKLNKAQREFYEIIPLYDKFVILKSRQLGMSTFVALYYLDKVLWEPNKEVAMIAHIKEAAMDLYNKKAQFAIRNMPQCVRDLITFGKESSTRLQVVKPKTGDTSIFSVLVSSRSGTPTHTHISELGKMSKKDPIRATEILSGSISALSFGHKLFIESTAEGAQGLFYETFNASWKERSRILPGSPYAMTMCFPLFFNWTYDEGQISQVTQIIPAEDMEVIDIDWVEFQKDNNLTDKEITWYYLKWLGVGKDTQYLFQEFPTTPEDAFLASGQCFFSQRRVSQMIEKINDNKPLSAYDIFGGELMVNNRGKFMVYKKPETGKQYTTGADVGQGLDDGDFSVAVVIDNSTKEIVAFYRVRREPYEFAEDLNCIGRYYSTAKLVVESNKDGYYVNDRLVKDFEYPNMYIQQSYDKTTRKYTDKIGWDTNAKTRQLGLISLKVAFNTIDTWYIKSLLEEMQTFVMNKRGKFEALPGKHDDCVMACSVAYGSLNAELKEKKKDSPEKKYTRMAVAFGEITMEEYLEYAQKHNLL